MKVFCVFVCYYKLQRRKTVFCKLLFQTEILSESKVQRIRIQRARKCVCDFNWTVSWSCKERIQNMKSAAVLLFVGTGL